MPVPVVLNVSVKHPINMAARPIIFTLVLLLAASMPARSMAACNTPVAEAGISTGLDTGQRYMGISLLAGLRLRQVDCKSLPLMGLSALAWSSDTGLLYALSDRGHVLHLRPRFNAGRLDNIDLVDAFPLRDADGRQLGINDGDSEGMTVLNGRNGIVGDEELVISFERRPRVSRYRVYGLWLADLALPTALYDISHYRTPNQALEGVVMHPRLGLLTAVERPLADQPDTQFGLYDSNGLHFALTRADSDYGSLTDITLTKDNNLLALERIFSGVFGIVAAVIHKIDADTGDSEIVVRLDFDDGHTVDNFEGLTRHEDNRYFMVSDNNGLLVQQTLLYYLELHEPSE